MKFAILFSLSLSFFTFREIEASEPASDFLSLCKATLQNNPNSLPLCEKVHQKFFINNKTKDIATVAPADVGALASPIDNKVQFFIFNDPNYLSGIAYCYFVFRNWISSAEISPDALAMSASGFSILNEDVKKYQNWLTTSTEGKKCKARVEKEAEVSVSNLELSLKDRVALIGLNPYASLHNPNPSYESVVDEMKLTINHERIHAYQVACPEFEKWSIAEWEKLPVATKNVYIKKYPSYTWSIPKIAGREYIGFLYESTPEKIGEHIKNCKIK